MIHQHLGHSVCFLVRYQIRQTVFTKLASAISIYGFPLIVSDMVTRSMYSFSPTYPAHKGTFTMVLAGILCSLVKQVSHPLFKTRIFCLADNKKNPLRNLFNVPLNPLCPPRSLWWHKLQTSFTIDSGRHIRHTYLIWFLLAALVNISAHSFILNTSGSNMELATKTSLALPLVSAPPSPVVILVLFNWSLHSRLCPWLVPQRFRSGCTGCAEFHSLLLQN